MVAFFSPPLIGGGNPTLYDAISDAGLLTNLKLCLDAGDSLSYPAGGTKWLDRSGGGYDFFLGTDATVQALDPTFNGVAGRQSKVEGFETDGTDYLSYDSAIESWMQAIGKINGVMSSLLIVTMPAAPTDIQLAGTYGDNGNERGWHLLYTSASNKFGFRCSTSADGQQQNAASPDVSAPGLMIWGLSLTLASGGAFVSQLNGVDATGNLAAFTPTNTNPTNNMKILAYGDASFIADAGTIVHGLAVWQGTALTSAQLLSIFSRIRNRFGL